MKIKGNKIELICYSCDSLSYTWKGDPDEPIYYLCSSLKFAPHNNKFTKEQIQKILDLCMNNRLKITIEKEGR